MADDNPAVTQTPVPVPTYGQPQSAAPAPAPVPSPTASAVQSQPTETETETETPAIPAVAEVQTEAAPPTAESNGAKDVPMMDADPAASPAPAPAPVQAPARTGTPKQENANTATNTSRAASAHPDASFTMPAVAAQHGAPVRKYLNTKVTPHLLEGMKLVAKMQPADPLRVLGEFLIERSKEFES
ncbi:hypothetical protein F4808DRAFT_439432 [Astrocystis sublimbata]|nr:hypothetical protein F4808DRAFT_439432 [Astrocystis sublimbata]